MQSLRNQLTQLWKHKTDLSLAMFEHYLLPHQRFVLADGIAQTAAAKLQPNTGDKKQYMALIAVLVGDVQTHVREAAADPQSKVLPFVRTALHPGGVPPPTGEAADAMCAALGRFLGINVDGNEAELLSMVTEFRTIYSLRVLDLFTRQLVRIELCQGRAHNVSQYVTCQRRPSRSEETIVY